MKNINDIVVTPELRAQYGCGADNDETIQCFEYIKAQTSKRLRSLIKFTPAGNISYGNKKLVEFVKELTPNGETINWSWVISNVGEIMYLREDMSDEDYSHLQDILD